MKKTLLILVLALAALSACRKSGPAEEPVAATYDLSQLRFDFTVLYPTETKAVKSGWTTGDQIYIFFSGITSHYLTLSYDGSVWATAPTLHPGEGSPSLSKTGLLTAIYLPYGNSAVPSYDSSWSFSGNVTDSYFLKAEKVTYQITDDSDITHSLNTLGAVLEMEVPAGYAQFFIPNADAAADVRLACNLMKPGGLTSIAADGTVVENTSGAVGSWITGYNATVGDAKGYYVSGKPIDGPDEDCYFVLDTETADEYKHYYKYRQTPITERGAYKLPAPSDWTLISASDYVTFGNYIWKVANDGATYPWQLGSTVASSARTTSVPTDAAWTALLNDADIYWVNMTILGQAGSLVVEEYESDRFRYMFLPHVDYWSINETHYLHFDGSGNASLITTGVAPASDPYVRQFKEIYHGGFDDPIDGGAI